MKSKESGLLPHYSPIEMLQTAWQFAFADTRERFHGEERDIFVMELAKKCRKAGLEEEFAVKRLLHVTPFRDYEVEVRKCFRNIYGTPTLNCQLPLPHYTLQMERLKEFLRRRYRFRRNTITDGAEYIERGLYVEEWRPLTKAVLNTVTMNAIAEGIEAWDKDVRRYVESTLVEEYDPIQDWLRSLPRWDRHDHVGDLARRVPTDNAYWEQDFRIWMRAMVAGWTGRNLSHGNTMTPLLIGAQGDGKSTFCKMILPEELQPYYTDRIDFANRNEAERAITRFALINLDEYDSVTKRQNAFLKHILQKVDVKTRKMYESVIEQRRRYATFIGTTNDPTPLTDVSGSRRFLCVQMTGRIDTAGKVDYPQLYAQVVSEIRRKKATYFDHDQEARIQQQNADFQLFDDIEEVFLGLYRLPKKGEQATWMSPTEIIREMRQRYHGIQENARSLRRLGCMLKRRGFERRRTRNHIEYRVASV